ncbi:unnamed protein product, partial [Allacma fusca]
MRRSRFGLESYLILAVGFQVIALNVTLSDNSDLGNIRDGEKIIMQWCGKEDEFPSPLIVIPDSISEEKINFSVKLQPGLVTCHPGENLSNITVSSDIHSQN